MSTPPLRSLSDRAVQIVREVHAELTSKGIKPTIPTLLSALHDTSLTVDEIDLVGRRLMQRRATKPTP